MTFLFGPSIQFIRSVYLFRSIYFSPSMLSSVHYSWLLTASASPEVSSAELSSAWLGVLGLLILVQVFSFGILAYAVLLNRRLIFKLRSRLLQEMPLHPERKITRT